MTKSKKRKAAQLAASIQSQSWKGGMFIPENPLVKMMQSLFLHEGTADASFEVEEEGIDGTKENDASLEQKGLVSTRSFHVHHLILRCCAPQLADLFDSTKDTDGSGGSMATVKISGVKQDVFEHLLRYVYGGKVPEAFLLLHAIDVIDAADKFAIVNLKLEAEAAFLKKVVVTMNNAVEILLYADAKNCALMKEAVFDFFFENDNQGVAKIMDYVPGNLMKDFFVAVPCYNKRRANAAIGKLPVHEGNINLMRVSELRMKLIASGLDADGSREAMIEALKPKSKCVTEIVGSMH